MKADPMPTHLHQTIAVGGVYELLREFEAMPATAVLEPDVVAMMQRLGIESVEPLVADLLAANLLQRFGERIGITTFGIRTMLLVEAINGGDLRDVYRRLGHYEPSLCSYELVREGMTAQFLESVVNRPGFARLYFCSPWIRLNARQQAMLTHAVVAMEQRGASPELLVVTRPAEGTTNTPPPGTEPFQDLGASIFLNGRLHTKLYIREPDKSGGFSMAIVGSQNLTKSDYLELGIKVNADSAMIDQLIGYFWELCSASHEV